MIKSQTIGARLGLAMRGGGVLLSAATALAQTGNPGLDSPGEALSRTCAAWRKIRRASLR
jgi:hypothetical protein